MLRFPLALLIVTEHVWHLPETSGYACIFVNRFMYGFVREYGVPIYFFISGFVFFYNLQSFDRSIYISKLKKRVKTLVVPYFIWNTIALIVRICYRPILICLFPSMAYNINWSVTNILNCYWCYNNLLISDVPMHSDFPINTSLWFLRSLFAVVICSPILYKIIKKKELGVIAVVLMGIIWILLRQRYFVDIFYQLSESMFFFSWGAYMSIHKKDLSVSFKPLFALSIFVYLVFGTLSCLYETDSQIVDSIIKCIGITSAVVLSYNLADSVNCKKYSETLLECGFFIYVSHMVFFNQCETIAFGLLHPQTTAMIFVTYFIKMIIVFTLSMGLFYVMHKCIPRVLYVMIGR